MSLLQPLDVTLHLSSHTPGLLQPLDVTLHLSSHTPGLLQPLDVILNTMLERLATRLTNILSRRPLDMDYLQFTCSQELVLLSAFSQQLTITQSIMDSLHELLRLVIQENSNKISTVDLTVVQSERGRPKFVLCSDSLKHFLKQDFTVPCIAQLMGVSERTIFRRMSEMGLSVRGQYTTCTDEELDVMITQLKKDLSHSGYRLIKGTLRSQGVRVQWERVRASMHRVDTVGVMTRLNQLGCIVRRTYTVPGPGHLMHIDTNHKLIRYNIVIFGGINGFSRKPITTTSTALHFFDQSVAKYGFPLRVRGDHGTENVDIARLMFAVRGTGRSSFIAEKVIERLWWDVWCAVTQQYYHVLHSLEDDGLLNLTSNLHLFCAHYVFIPRLQASLDVFAGGWNNHALKSESNITPNQLWELGQSAHPAVDNPENVEGLHLPYTDWEDSGLLPEDEHQGVVVPDIGNVLEPEQMVQLRNAISPLGQTQYHEEIGLGNEGKKEETQGGEMEMEKSGAQRTERERGGFKEEREQGAQKKVQERSREHRKERGR
ncbi:hypothetical protein WMY93_029829 [Mugilogobius chulae]|uniref:Integrase core domain-containing protein n=1 Tax=Mugilogobius chulae TaxID=88201 RepID=A0AAW0MPM5_9GOBI